jgi:hypothetical protein
MCLPILYKTDFCEQPNDQDYADGIKKKQMVLELDMPTWKVSVQSRSIFQGKPVHQILFPLSNSEPSRCSTSQIRSFLQETPPKLAGQSGTASDRHDDH